MRIIKISTYILATIFHLSGCSDIKDEILTKQMEIYEKGKLCVILKTEKSCEDYSKGLEELTNILDLHGADLFKQAKNGNKKAKKIIIQAYDIIKFNESSLK